jgi:hypothetical protein
MTRPTREWSGKSALCSPRRRLTTAQKMTPAARIQWENRVGRSQMSVAFMAGSLWVAARAAVSGSFFGRVAPPFAGRHPHSKDMDARGNPALWLVG